MQELCSSLQQHLNFVFPEVELALARLTSSTSVYMINICNSGADLWGFLSSDTDALHGCNVSMREQHTSGFLNMWEVMPGKSTFKRR